MVLSPENWEIPQKILVILAHPDDPEFFLGGAIARWTAAGHEVEYCLLTRGDKGVKEGDTDPNILIKTREREQHAAAAILGVKKIQFYSYADGYLEVNLTTRKDVVRVIRDVQPSIVVGCDPTNIFPHENYINHPDHRAAGQIVVDAVFPAAGNAMFYPELAGEGLKPHSVKEVWLSLTHQPNVVLDVTPFWEQRLRALHEHGSQIGPDVEAFDRRMRSAHTPESSDNDPVYVHTFRRIVFR